MKQHNQSEGRGFEGIVRWWLILARVWIAHRRDNPQGPSPGCSPTRAQGACIHQKRAEGPARQTSHAAPIWCKSLVPSDAELALDGIDGTQHAFVLCLDQAADFPDCADDRSVVFAAESLA